MRYYYQKPDSYEANYGIVYRCNHAVYSECTLYFDGVKGLSVIQQRFNPKNKSTYWTRIDPWLVDELYLKDGFQDYFYKHARYATNGLFPTVTVRQIMWALKMKPIKRERWETVFDKCPI